MRRTLLALPILSLASALVACGPPVPSPDAGATYAQVQTVLDHSCATTLSSCHTTGGAGGVDLTAANSYAAIVGVASLEVPSMPYVTANDTSNSYLFRKIDNSFTMIPACTMPANDCGTRMPMVGGETVDAADLETLRAWIMSGAPHN